MSASVTLTKSQRTFLELLDGNPTPHSFAWLQVAQSGRGLVAAYGHPDTWTHFQARSLKASAVVTKEEARELASLGLTSNCRITPAGREVVAVEA